MPARSTKRIPSTQSDAQSADADSDSNLRLPRAELPLTQVLRAIACAHILNDTELKTRGLALFGKDEKKRIDDSLDSWIGTQREIDGLHDLPKDRIAHSSRVNDWINRWGPSFIGTIDPPLLESRIQKVLEQLQ